MNLIETLLQLQALREQVEDLIDQVRQTSPKKAKAPKAKKTRGRGPAARRSREGGAAAGGNKLAIVVGHTAVAPGAGGTAPINASEYPWNRDLAQRIATYAATRGVEVETFLRDDGGVSGAYSRVDGWGARAAIELHFNAADGTARGTETLHGTSADSASWAGVVQRAMVTLYGRTGSQNRGLKPCPPHPRGGASVNALPHIPTCLIEPFFGDNSSDATLGQGRKQDLARALVDVFKTHFGV